MRRWFLFFSVLDVLGLWCFNTQDNASVVLIEFGGAVFKVFIVSIRKTMRRMFLLPLKKILVKMPGFQYASYRVNTSYQLK